MSEGDIAIGKAVMRPNAGELVGPRGRARLIGTQLLLARALLDAKGRTLSRAFLADVLWGAKPDPRIDRGVDVHLSHLRRKLAAVGSGVMLLSVRHVGYCITLPEHAGDARLLTVAQTRLLAEVVAAAGRADAELARRFEDAGRAA